MTENLPDRKTTRYKNFDYNSGIVFLTICTKNRKQILSKIIGTDVSTCNSALTKTVGDGASTSRLIFEKYTVKLTPIGKIVEKYILSSNNIPGVKVWHYVIMPNHIHLLASIGLREIAQDNNAYGSRDVGAPSPTRNRQNNAVSSLVSALKRLCNKEIGYNIFQRSYYDHIIRSDSDLDEHINYILENPTNWFYDELYSEE